MNMSVGTRSLTIHCYEPQAGLHSIPPVGVQAIALHFAPLAALREFIPRYRELLDPSEIERATRFRFEVDRERFIIAHGSLRSLLGEQLSEDPARIQLERGPYGKPFVPGSELRFNLSDTKDAMLVGITKGQEIGVDIETMQRRVDHLAVSEHYFTPEEVEAIALSSDTKRRFLEYWTRKEAVLKASGVGIMDDLKVLRVDAALNEMTISHEAFVRHAAAEYHVHTMHLGPEHIISLAAETRFVLPEVKDLKAPFA